MRDYLEETNVQLGASYNVAKQSTESYRKGLEAAAGFMGAASDEIGMINSQLASHSPLITLYLRCSDRPLNNPALL